MGNRVKGVGMNKEFEAFDDSFKDMLLPDSRLEALASPAIWAEGPVWLPERDAVVFSDVKGRRRTASPFFASRRITTTATPLIARGA